LAEGVVEPGSRRRNRSPERERPVAEVEALSEEGVMATVVLHPPQIDPHLPGGGPGAAGQVGEMADGERVVELVGALLELLERDGHAGIQQRLQRPLQAVAGHHLAHIPQLHSGVGE
jgi:hypothetical protein